ncbi:hypothetical protein [Escherichia coli]|uniref:hypothetical protein n=1 Tax=Escherichia coli TaxID=562 RepID=UPI001F0F9D4D|nr:hypothetical protein [Escherichia coli]
MQTRIRTSDHAAEAKAVEDANTALDTAKQAAQEAVNKVPEGTEVRKVCRHVLMV